MDAGARQLAQDAYDRLPGRDRLRAVAEQAQQVAAKTARDAKGTAVELAWIATHLVTYPLGLLSEKQLTWPLLHRRGGASVEDARTTLPVLLVHGLGSNRSVFTVLARELRRNGFGNVYALNYNPFPSDARAAAVRLAEEIERICQETGHDQVHLVGHSLGGLLARYYVQRLGGDQRAATLVTLGTPHHGTKLARLMPYRVPGQLLPDSELIVEMAEPAPGCRTRFVCFASDLDELMSPRETAALEHDDLDVRIIHIAGVGHASLPADRGVVAAICRLLRGDD